MTTPSLSHVAASRRLIRFIRQNCGTTADWPMEITFDDDIAEENFHQIWADFCRATDDASPIFPAQRDWLGGGTDPTGSASLHD